MQKPYEKKPTCKKITRGQDLRVSKSLFSPLLSSSNKILPPTWHHTMYDGLNPFSPQAKINRVSFRLLLLGVLFMATQNQPMQRVKRRHSGECVKSRRQIMTHPLISVKKKIENLKKCFSGNMGFIDHGNP